MPTYTNTAEVKVIAPEGHLRIGDKVDQLRADIEHNLHAGHSRLVIDLTRVVSLDSTGIGVIVRALTLSKQQGGSLKLVNPAEQVTQTLKITGLLKLFDVYSDPASAIAAFG